MSAPNRTQLAASGHHAQEHSQESVSAHGCLELGQCGCAQCPKHHGCLSSGPGKELCGDSLDLSDREVLSELPRSLEVGGEERQGRGILVRGVWREDFSSPAYSFPPASVLFDASGEKGTADSIKAWNGRWNRGCRGRQGWLSRCTLKPGPHGLPEKVQPSAARIYRCEAPGEGNGPAFPAAWPFWDVTPLKTEGGGKKNTSPALGDTGE